MVNNVKHEFVKFGPDRGENQAALRNGLVSNEPQFIAVHFDHEWTRKFKDTLREAGLPSTAFISSAEVYDLVTLNAFVKDNPTLPAVGFIRVRLVR